MRSLRSRELLPDVVDVAVEPEPEDLAEETRRLHELVPHVDRELARLALLDLGGDVEFFLELGGDPRRPCFLGQSREAVDDPDFSHETLSLITTSV